MPWHDTRDDPVRTQHLQHSLGALRKFSKRGQDQENVYHNEKKDPHMEKKTPSPKKIMLFLIFQVGRRAPSVAPPHPPSPSPIPHVHTVYGFITSSI